MVPNSTRPCSDANIGTGTTNNIKGSAHCSKRQPATELLSMMQNHLSSASLKGTPARIRVQVTNNSKQLNMRMQSLKYTCHNGVAWPFAIPKSNEFRTMARMIKAWNHFESAHRQNCRSCPSPSSNAAQYSSERRCAAEANVGLEAWSSGMRSSAISCASCTSVARIWLMCVLFSASIFRSIVPRRAEAGCTLPRAEVMPRAEVPTRTELTLVAAEKRADILDEDLLTTLPDGALQPSILGDAPLAETCVRNTSSFELDTSPRNCA
mmetsp:Transcript_90409/g.260617  ORF Transcript_90409/g.260617 Transcript_90409/m.260617 type:complete len:266 (-) Transcript_90409:104-901(-)